MGDKVPVGVNVGVKVIAAVWELAISIGAAATAVCVKADTIVCAMVVPRVLESMVDTVGPVTGMVGRPQASEIINKTITNKRNGVGFRMVPPFADTANHNAKNAEGFAQKGTFAARALFLSFYLQIKNLCGLFMYMTCCILHNE